jgi:hypothetical protein
MAATQPAGINFQPSTYTIKNGLIAHSKVTKSTNGDVDVYVQSLIVNASGTATGTATLLVVRFVANDTQTNFAFYGLKNVSFSDNEGNTYSPSGATTPNNEPPQVMLQPHEEGTLQVTFPALPTHVTWLDLYFNTDGDSLVPLHGPSSSSPCLKLMPNDTTSAC